MIRSVLITFLILALASLISAQSVSQHIGDNVPQVTGQLVGYTPEKYGDLELKFTVLRPYSESQDPIVVDISDDGSFVLDLQHPFRYRQAWFHLGDLFYSELIFDKGLHITADLDQLSSGKSYWLSEHVVFSGPDADLNTSINGWIEYRNEHVSDESLPYMVLMDRESTAQEKGQEYQRRSDSLLVHLESYIKESGTAHGDILKNKFESDLLGNLIIIYIMTDIPDAIMQRVLSHQPLTISNESYSYYKYWTYKLKQMSDSQRKAMYQQLGEHVENASDKMELDYLLANFDKELTGDAKKKYHSALKVINAQFSDILDKSKTKHFINNVIKLPAEKGDMLLLYGVPKELRQQEIYHNMVQSEMQLEGLKQYFNVLSQATIDRLKKVEERLAALANTSDVNVELGESIGKVGETSLYLANHSSVDSLIQGIMQAHPDKMIVLDVWATWCGPCLGDMKNAHESVRKLSQNDIEVIYLCTDEGTTEDRWKDKVLDLALPATNIKLSKKLSNDIMEYFDLSGYPSHVVIDKNRKVHKNLIHAITNVDIERLKGAK